MASRCGCNSSTCNCIVRAGANVHVSGSGTAISPYVISADAATVAPLDTATVDMHVTGGPAYTVSADVIRSTDAGNILVLHANGVYVPAPCISTDAGNEIVFGTDGCLYAPAATAFTNGNGIAAIVGGVIEACLSTDAGNSITFGADGCLFVAASAGTPVTVGPLDTFSIDTTVTGGPNYTVSSDVIRDPSAQNLLTVGPTGVLVDLVTGCGLSGIGTAASPLVVDTNAAVWPFACAESNGAKVYCDATTGGLVVDPEKFLIDVYVKRIVVAGIQDIATLVPGPYPQPNTLIGPTFTLTVTNPSPCRPLRFTLWGGFAHFNLRMNNAGRGNVLTSISITGGAGATLVTAGDQFHEQWMRDQLANEADNTFDTQGTIVDGIYTLPAATSATFTAQAQLQITNYDAGMVITLSDLELSMHAMGSN